MYIKIVKSLLCLITIHISVLCFSQDQPNIIVIFTDDHGYADIGINGQENDVKTPHIDQLARNGVRMTAGYVTAPQCIPSRAGLLTGKYQQRFGVDHNGTIPLPLNETLIAERMQQAGYTTGMAGKWHLGPNRLQTDWIQKNLPNMKDEVSIKNLKIPMSKKMPYMSPNRGFEKVYQGPMRKYLINYNLEGRDVEEQWVQNDDYRLDVQTDAALAFIKNNHDRPFFFYLAYFAPHVPLEAPKKYLKRFPGEMPTRRRYALAMISAIDDGVGKIKQTLKNLNIDDNTVVFFISDNGAPLKMHKVDAPGVGPGWNGSLNTPWIGEKGMLSEGGIRVPFIVNWPKGLPKGKVYKKPVISLDVAATSIALAGLDPVEELDGVNLIPFLNGDNKEPPHKAIYWRFWGQSAIRMGNYKYLHAGNREYLFDVTSPEHETKNLISQYPEKTKAMKKRLKSWANELHNPGIPQGKLKQSEEAWYNFYFPSPQHN